MVPDTTAVKGMSSLAEAKLKSPKLRCSLTALRLEQKAVRQMEWDDMEGWVMRGRAASWNRS